MKQIEPYCFPTFQVLNSDSNDNINQGTELSAQQFFTLESTPAPTNYSIYSSPSDASFSSTNRTPFSPQLSNSYISDNTYDSHLTSLSEVDDENKLMHALWVIRNELLGTESEFDDSCSFNGTITTQQPSPSPSSSFSPFTKYNRILEMAPHMDLKQLILACAETVSEADPASSERTVVTSAAEALLDILEKSVSVSGEPLQRLGAYILEGLRARLLSSGSIICKKLKCNKEPTSSELLSYMHVLYQICPYYKFAYVAANAVILDAMSDERTIHVIDFQIAQGSQWAPFIQAVARRPGGPPRLRITGVDDSNSTHARGGGLHSVGQRLTELAESMRVPFEFHGAGTSGCGVHLENLIIRQDEALAVNFPYILHHMPDENVISSINHRDRVIKLVKSLSPKVVTLVEQESNTNTEFLQRFCETLDYYTAMFESIGAGRVQDDRLRISAEEHCVAKDVVNILACEGTDRVERHELFGKWRLRFMMAGFGQVRLGAPVHGAVSQMLSEYSSEYRSAEGNGAIYLGWKSRALATFSAWR